ncbi:hypothetical protein IEO21_06858 [Rhodonia placenta]|uniref:Fungal-type protein kinase domain-containing protein n=1 Tax=Rhodonia placenta TaxID=104341 RepID=A0A8H7NZ33_9APHY|nr:hypothetical protein IEO21_06858 [Postia placenta]
MDIGLCAEYKTYASKKYRNDNVCKVVWSMRQCMREDSRRRFVYGLTIENTTMRLWYASRAELLVSERIHWQKDHKTVVNIFQALMYAEEHTVGWDPTIIYVIQKDKGRRGMKSKKSVADEIELAEDNSPRVDIFVRDKDGKESWYRTNKLISDFGADGLRGRGTRVWKAKKLVVDESTGEKKEEGPDVVIKVSYIDDDRQREGSILAQIYDFLVAIKKESFYERCFLSVITHGDVYVHGRLDQTRQLMTRGLPIPEHHATFVVQVQENESASAKTSRGTGPSRTGTGDYRSSEPGRPFLYKPRTHYRIVFKEVCQRISDLRSLQSITEVLIQALIGKPRLSIQAMASLTVHCSPWYHA